MKRSFILALCAILVLASLLVACSGKGGDEKASADSDLAVNGGTSVETDAESDSDAIGTEEQTFVDLDTIMPGVAWSDLVDITDEPGETDDDTVDVDGNDMTDTTDDLWPFPESGIELPIIPLP